SETRTPRPGAGALGLRQGSGRFRGRRPPSAHPPRSSRGRTLRGRGLLSSAWLVIPRSVGRPRDSEATPLPRGWQAPGQVIDSVTFYSTIISTRRFLARPAAVPLSATGSEGPLPTARSLPEATPACSRRARTASARRWDRAWLAASLPWLSVWPTTVIVPLAGSWVTRA